MKYNSLLDYFSLVPSDRTFIVGDSASITYGNVAHFVPYIRLTNYYKSIYGKKIAVKISSNNQLALLLSVLDGHCSSLLLLPSGLDSATLDDLVREVGDHEFFDDRHFVDFESLKNGELTTVNLPVQTDWIIPTSGTTNRPKLIRHTLLSLTKSCKFDLEKGRFVKWCLMYDIYRFAGLQVYFQTIFGGSILLIPGKDYSLEKSIQFFSENGGNCLSASPTMWRKISMCVNCANLSLKQITLGGEIVDQYILNYLSEKFPLARITHIYASTELGVGFAVNDKVEGFPIDWLVNGFKDLKIRIAGDGLLQIKADNTGVYCNATDCNGSDGFFDTGDLVEIKSNRVVFLGRASGAINVGGNKVQPEEIERVAMAVDGVLLAQAIGIKSSITGMLVSLNVETSSESDNGKILLALKREFTINLPPFKRPAVIKFVKSLPTSSNGKILRNRIL